LSSPKRKIKIELEDNEGDRYNLSLEGKFSKEKMIRVFELIESFESKTTKEPTSLTYDDTSTLASRIWNIVQDKCHDTTFTSAFIFNKYNEVYEEKLQLSVISTYLSRFFVRNKLARIKHGKEWIYSVIDINENLSQSHDVTHHYHFPTVYDLHQ
jgi:hypothetical protein